MSLSDCFMLCSHIFSIKNNTETKKLTLQGALYVTHPIRCATSTYPSRGYEFESCTNKYRLHKSYRHISAFRRVTKPVYLALKNELEQKVI